MNPIQVQRLKRFSFISIITILAFLAFYFSLDYTYPFVLGYLFAFFLNPMVKFFSRKFRFPNMLSVIVAMIIFFGFIFGVISLVIFFTILGANHLLDVLPGHFQTFAHNLKEFVDGTLYPAIENLNKSFKNINPTPDKALSTYFSFNSSDISRSVISNLQTILKNLPGLFLWIPDAALGILFTMLATFFISNQWDKLFNTWKSIVPGNYFEPIRIVFIDMKKAATGFIRAQLIIVSLTTIVSIIGCFIIGVKNPVTMGLIVGTCDFLPYIGTAICFIPWILFSFITGKTLLGIGLLGLFGVILVQRQLLEPKIIASNMGIDPLATLIVMFVGLKLMGVLGVLFGAIILVVFTTLKEAGILKEIQAYIKGD
ncbi:MAG: rane protein ytvI [Bacillales bacterium]|jgi:sporulation integral membrane protein YtvI|nr:rane protein ytvI [Bacillales bacterium]